MKRLIYTCTTMLASLYQNCLAIPPHKLSIQLVVYHSQYVNKLFKLRNSQRFGQTICNYSLGGNLFKVNHSLTNQFSYFIMFNGNVLGLVVILRVFVEFDYSWVIGKNYYKRGNCLWVIIFDDYFKNTKFSQKSPNLNGFIRVFYYEMHISRHCCATATKIAKMTVKIIIT